LATQWAAARRTNTIGAMLPVDNLLQDKLSPERAMRESTPANL